jgi:tripartite-type tricarboxylate transporter receptor subunit TctC
MIEWHFIRGDLMQRRHLAAALATLATPWAGLALGQSDYPNKPIRLVMGFPPGGSGDFAGRALGDEMGRLLGQPVVGDNRPGAATNIASEIVAKAPADGYTLLLGGSFSHSVNPALFARMPVDVARDFTPVGKVVSSPTVFAVPASLPVNNMREFLAYAKKEGDKVNFASSGIGSPGHIAGGYVNRFAGLQMTHVPYKGAGESVRALIAGEVQLIITSPTSIMGFVRQGRAKALALTTTKASSLVPGVPGAEEAGLPNFDINGWYGLYGPAGMPTAITSRLHAALNQALSSAALKEKLAAQGLEVDLSPSPEAFARFGAADRQAWAVIVRDSGARVE